MLNKQDLVINETKHMICICDTTMKDKNKIVIRYISKQYDGDCVICYQSKKLIKTWCNHELCLNCRQKISICPFCRRDLKN